MKKRLVSLALATVMALSLVACGSSSSDTDVATDTDTSATEEATADATAKDASDVKIGIVLDVGGVNDGSFNQSSWEGLERAMDELGIQGSYLESSGDADYATNIETFMDEDCDLIICVGYMIADATKAAAEANPDQKFAIIDDSTIDLDNVECLMFKQEQASYLVGYVAGLMTETNTVGIELGMASDAMHLFGYGYVAGAMDANPDITVLQSNANSFASTETGKTDANTMITNGADIIFHAAGGTGLGVIDACQEAGIKAIGVDSDQHAVAEGTVITSAMKRVDNAVYDVAEQILNDTYQGGITTYDLTTGGVDIAPTTDYLTDDVIAAIEDVKAKIISGEITVPSSKEEFEAAYGDVYTLD